MIDAELWEGYRKRTTSLQQRCGHLNTLRAAALTGADQSGAAGRDPGFNWGVSVRRGHLAMGVFVCGRGGRRRVRTSSG